ncbi:MAG: NUDIX hydrolase [Pseudomonadota bacterium]|nr:MAG: NUDIX hydrolase [Pseudomonadota bacterium]
MQWRGTTRPESTTVNGSDQRKSLYRGRIIELGLETVELPNGTVMEMEIVRHPGGAAVVALDEGGRVCLLRQYRHAVGGWLWELPAGKIDDNEPPLQTAQRELQEEAGCRASKWCPLGAIISSPGVFTEQVHLFLATGLSAVAQDHAHDEVIEVHWLSFEQALSWAHSGELRDAKSVVGLLRAARQV